MFFGFCGGGFGVLRDLGPSGHPASRLLPWIHVSSLTGWFVQGTLVLDLRLLSRLSDGYFLVADLLQSRLLEEEGWRLLHEIPTQEVNSLIVKSTA